LLNNECETYGISPHLVANRLELEKMANGNGRIRASCGWRFEVFGKKAIRLINSA
jgi:ribonuclease D